MVRILQITNVVIKFFIGLLVIWQPGNSHFLMNSPKNTGNNALLKSTKEDETTHINLLGPR